MLRGQSIKNNPRLSISILEEMLWLTRGKRKLILAENIKGMMMIKSNLEIDIV